MEWSDVNFASRVSDKTNTLINSATSQIKERNASTKRQLENTLNSSTLGKADASSATSKLVDKYTTETKKTTSAYTNPNA
jgi:hypothetical protein